MGVKSVLLYTLIYRALDGHGTSILTAGDLAGIDRTAYHKSRRPQMTRIFRVGALTALAATRPRKTGM